MDGKLVYALITSTPKAFKRVKEEEVRVVKSAPGYLEIIPKIKILDEKTAKVNGYDTKILVKSFFPETIVVEAHVELKEVFSKEIFELKDKLFETCKKISETYKPAEFIEEYSVCCVKDYTNIDETINKNRSMMASILKDEPITLDEDEVQETLSVNMSYGKNDKIIVDWDGAIIFDKTGEFEEAINLMEIANIQLLGLRRLDSTLGSELEKMKDLGLGSKKLLQFKKMRSVFRDIIRIRSESMLDLEGIEGRIKLYGDWYSGKLYDLVSKKLHIDRWKQSVNNKLIILQQLYEMVDKTISDLYNIILELTVFGGYILLIIIEFYLAMRYY